MVFEVKETSSITASGNGYSRTHDQLSDAMEKAINWLANQPVGKEVTITETTTVKRTAQKVPTPSHPSFFYMNKKEVIGYD